ncbi:MAG: hypothetical protein HZB26_10445 [Candidatus Hydrogenedentes bacterium]|nr:hypothetical protein [Candidatus Hydrogenedentota bacterium]
MIVPQYWAEGRAKARQDKQQVTVRRFGWSDISQEDAQQQANARSQEALQRILSGVKLDRSEPKISYNGAAGVPIREEVVERHGETVITRNSYGARCLNTPNVLFADIDFQTTPTFQFIAAIVLTTLAAAIVIGWYSHSTLVWAALLIFIVMASRPLAGLLYSRIHGTADDMVKAARERVRGLSSTHPEWGSRLYRTPAGVRVLVTHRPFQPNEPEVRECFQALRVDPLFAQMCLNQQCFRARVSPKPWRIGIPDHMRPRPGIWPVAPERMPLRQRWIDRYESMAVSFSACSFLESVGADTIHPVVAPVLRLHDDLSKAASGLPIA